MKMPPKKKSAKHGRNGLKKAAPKKKAPKKPFKGRTAIA